jgi:hypothetical protein
MTQALAAATEAAGEPESGGGTKHRQAVVLLRAAGSVPAGTGLTFYARVK